MEIRGGEVGDCDMDSFFLQQLITLYELVISQFCAFLRFLFLIMWIYYCKMQLALKMEIGKTYSWFC